MTNSPKKHSAKRVPNPKSSLGTISTPYGFLNLASPGAGKKMKSMVIQLHRTTDALTRKDIADWRAAWQQAINVDSPNRQRLYDIYTDTLIDNHLSGCIEQRRGFVMAHAFRLIDRNGKEDRAAAHYFAQAWFKKLLRLCHDSIWWGHSLIELGEIVKDGDGCLSFRDVTLIPRKHVIPEYHCVIENVGDDHTSGHDYTMSPYCSSIIEAGSRDCLGILLKAAPQTIAKKNALAFWDSFQEIFGMPMRIARTTTRDPKERARLENMMRDAAHNLAVITGMETEIEFVESGKGDAYNVYDKRVDRANSELSKLTVGQTMTVEDGSSLSQSQTHLEVLENLVASDLDTLCDIINNQLLPIMVANGFPLKGLLFSWAKEESYTPEQQVAFETMIADRYEVDPTYFAEKYGMPVGERRNNMPTAGADTEVMRRLCRSLETIPAVTDKFPAGDFFD